MEDEFKRWLIIACIFLAASGFRILNLQREIKELKTVNEQYRQDVCAEKLERK